jgi:hypothetical protein
MLQVVFFIVALLILLANNFGTLFSIFGAIVLSYVAGLCVMAIVHIFVIFSEKKSSSYTSSSSTIYREYDDMPQRVADTTPSSDYAVGHICEPTKENWKAFEVIIQREHIFRLYHFTDVQNLPSIVNSGGLQSWSELARNRIVHVQGSNDLSRKLDCARGLQDYVRLCFRCDHPMAHIAINEGRIRELVWLEIDPRVIYFSQTRLSDRNATDNDAIIGSTIDDFKAIRFDILRKNRWESSYEKTVFQSEVLVHRAIPSRYILNLGSASNTPC